MEPPIFPPFDPGGDGPIGPGGPAEPSHTFPALVELISQTRESLRSQRLALAGAREAIAIAGRNLALAEKNGLDTQDFLDIISTQTSVSDGIKSAIAALLVDETSYVNELNTTYTTHQLAVANLSDAVPILFFPVRLETAFQKVGNQQQLWVRIFPDDIAVETHEELLSETEIEEGKAYWRRYKNAGSDAERLQAWDLVSRSYGPQRAAWVALQTTPPNLNTATNGSQLTFPSLTPKSNSWTEQPVTRILPDAFVVHCYSYLSAPGGTPAYTVQGLPIPDEVKLGIDPHNDTFLQQNGDITAANPEAAWMVDFDAAVAKGLGVKINIGESDSYYGLRNILVLGVKLSLTAGLSQTRLERLINSHHYTDGFALLKQGTSTSNTDTELSGYSSVDHGNAVTQATERSGPLFTPVTTNTAKRDGQILCDALGIEYDTLYHIFHSGGNDIISAMAINNSLWQATLGYYFSQLMNPLIEVEEVDKLRDFFTDFVRSRGALPSIRSGRQPYGILPTSVLSRLQWSPSSGPHAGLYGTIKNVTATFAGNVQGLTDGLDVTTQGGSGEQHFSNVVSHSPVSQSYVRRIGLGAGTIWNTLSYTDNTDQTLMTDWLNEQTQRMQNLGEDLGLDLSQHPRIGQINFLDQHSPLTIPLVAPPGVRRDQQLPAVNGGMNYLKLIASASFHALRDEDFSAYGIGEGQLQPSLLYQTARLSVLMEYYQAACKLLNIPPDEQVAPELVNIDLEGKEEDPESTFKLHHGPSPWLVLEQPYGDYETVAQYLDSGDQTAETYRLHQTKNSLQMLSEQLVGDLSLLTAELIDSTSYRLDAWRLALVNERLNTIRGIVDGSTARTKGIFLGAYGWLEGVFKKEGRIPVIGPTTNFPGTYYESGGLGYVHAPSIPQAVNAAVLRSGYASRANQTEDRPLSVNLSSERVRSALELIEGIRNGQELSVLLGYEFERRLHDNYPGLDLDVYVDPFRQAYPLNNITTSTPAGVEEIVARNVLNGMSVVDTYRNSNMASLLTPVLAAMPPNTSVSPSQETALQAEVDWIWNLMDAVGDLAISESMYHIVQGNQTKGSAIADAVSKGNYLPDFDVLNTPRTGTYVNQRFAFHFTRIPVGSGSAYAVALPTGWAGQNARATAEPAINVWLGDLLGSPAGIQCKVSAPPGVTLTNSGIMSMADLELQPLDLLYLMNDELKNDDSELALRIRRYARASLSATVIGKDKPLTIDYDPEGVAVTFADVLPLFRYARKLVTSARSLNTKDYMLPVAAQSAVNDYDLADIGYRLAYLHSRLVSVSADLGTAIAAATPGGLQDALFNAGYFNLEQTIYEYSDGTAEDTDILHRNAVAVKARVDAWKTRINPSTGMPSSTLNPDAYLEEALLRIKLVLGEKFAVLPPFGIGSTEQAQLASALDSGSTLLADHVGPFAINGDNYFVMDEWVSSISKVKENSATYQLIAALGSAMNFEGFNVDRKLVPLQLPYTTGDRWMGAQVANQSAIKSGCVAFGASLPSGHSFSAGQVGLMVEEWIDALPSQEEVTGISFHYDQPGAKAPQCLVLGLPPAITGQWQWADIRDMFVEMFDLAKTRALSYEQLSQTTFGQLGPGIVTPFTPLGANIGLTQNDLFAAI